MRKSALFSIRHDHLPPSDFHRSVTKKINFGKTHIQRHSLIRHTSTFVNQLKKQKTKINEPKEKENEKTNKDITNKNVQRKITYKYNNFNFNKILKNIVLKQHQQKTKKNSFYKKKVGTRHFYFIRKQINQRLKNKYKSPYMLYLIEKGYYEHFKKSDYPKYYNFYMINYLMQKKRCKLTLRYYDNIFFYNNQEYLIRYFNRNEIFIIMNYVVYFVYNKDIRSIIKNNIKKKIISDEEIENMFNNLIKSNYNFLGTMEIFEDIAVYYRNVVMNNSNLSHMFFNLDNVKPILGQEIHYLYAKDVPVLQMPNSYPNFFPLEGVMLNYIKKFIKLRKFEKLKYNKIKNKSGEGTGVKFCRLENNENKNKGNDNNILMNLSLSMSKDKKVNDEKSESEENKYLHNSNRRLKIDNDIYDVETLIDKILNRYYGYYIKNKNNLKKIIPKKNETIFLKKEKIYQRSVKRFKTTQIISTLDNQKKYFLSPRPLKQEKNIEKNMELIKDLNRNSGIFKTSLKKLNELQKTKGDNSDKQLLIHNNGNNKGSNNNILSLKEGLMPKSTNNLKLILFKRKEKINKEFTSPYTKLNILKYSVKSVNINHNEIQKEGIDNNINKSKYNNNFINDLNFKDFINMENKFKNNSEFRQILPSKKSSRKSQRNNSSARSIFNFNDKNMSIKTPIREVSSNSSSQKIFFFKFKDTSKFISNSTKNRYNVNKYISLKKINSLSRNKALTQKDIDKKNYYKGLSQKAFSTYSGINFDEKVVNVWESSNKIEGVTVKDAYITNNLFTKIKNFNSKNQNDFKKSSSFNEIIKCPNIYMSNLG